MHFVNKGCCSFGRLPSPPLCCGPGPGYPPLRFAAALRAASLRSAWLLSLPQPAATSRAPRPPGRAARPRHPRYQPRRHPRTRPASRWSASLTPAPQTPAPASPPAPPSLAVRSRVRPPKAASPAQPLRVAAGPGLSPQPQTPSPRAGRRAACQPQHHQPTPGSASAPPKSASPVPAAASTPCTPCATRRSVHSSLRSSAPHSLRLLGSSRAGRSSAVPPLFLPHNTARFAECPLGAAPHTPCHHAPANARSSSSGPPQNLPHRPHKAPFGQCLVGASARPPHPQGKAFSCSVRSPAGGPSGSSVQGQQLAGPPQSPGCLVGAQCALAAAVPY